VTSSALTKPGGSVRPVTVADEIAERQGQLTPAERRAAQLILDDPDSVIFGTVASLAAKARTSPASVMRLATKLGFDGYAELRASMQQEISHQLRPAAELIQEEPSPDPLTRALYVETHNVRTTLSGVEPDVYVRAADRLADLKRKIIIVPALAQHFVGARMALELEMLRNNVRLAYGPQSVVAKDIALLDPGDVVVTLDVRRYDAWLVDTVHRAKKLGAHVITITDSRLSPYAAVSDETFIVSAEGVGPFDSHVGSYVLANTLVAGVATRCRRTAAGRLARIEDLVGETGVFLET